MCVFETHTERRDGFQGLDKYLIFQSQTTPNQQKNSYKGGLKEEKLHIKVILLSFLEDDSSVWVQQLSASKALVWARRRIFACCHFGASLLPVLSFFSFLFSFFCACCWFSPGSEIPPQLFAAVCFGSYQGAENLSYFELLFFFFHFQMRVYSYQILHVWPLTPSPCAP